MPLNTDCHFHRPGQRVLRAYRPVDDFYAALIGAHEGLSEAQSGELNAHLVLLLSNHIGDLDVLDEALRVARAQLDQAPSTPEGEPR